MASADDLARWRSQLVDVRAAIRAIETHGQAYAMDGSALQLTRADIDSLYSREREIEKKVARGTRGGIRTATIIPGRACS
jgi:hypothetical protein